MESKIENWLEFFKIHTINICFPTFGKWNRVVVPRDVLGFRIYIAAAQDKHHLQDLLRQDCTLEQYK